MLEWLRDWWQRVTTKPCDRCGESVPVRAYRQTGKTHRGNWWTGVEVEMECPHCGYTFWVRK